MHTECVRSISSVLREAAKKKFSGPTLVVIEPFFFFFFGREISKTDFDIKKFFQNIFPNIATNKKIKTLLTDNII